MTHEQFLLLAQILNLTPNPELEQEVRHPGAQISTQVQQILTLHLRLKEAYVIHRPTAFRVVVSHDDLDRFPGALDLKQGMHVQLVSYTSERYISVRITQLPATPQGVFQGRRQRAEHQLPRFLRSGTACIFSEDQVHAILNKNKNGLVPTRQGACFNPIFSDWCQVASASLSVLQTPRS